MKDLSLKMIVLPAIAAGAALGLVLAFALPLPETRTVYVEVVAAPEPGMADDVMRGFCEADPTSSPRCPEILR